MTNLYMKVVTSDKSEFITTKWKTVVNKTYSFKGSSSIGPWCSRNVCIAVRITSGSKQTFLNAYRNAFHVFVHDLKDFGHLVAAFAFFPFSQWYTECALTPIFQL